MARYQSKMPALPPFPGESTPVCVWLEIFGHSQRENNAYSMTRNCSTDAVSRIHSAVARHLVFFCSHLGREVFNLERAPQIAGVFSGRLACTSSIHCAHKRCVGNCPPHEEVVYNQVGIPFIQDTDRTLINNATSV